MFTLALAVLAGFLQILPYHCFVFAKNDKDIQFCNKNCWGWWTQLIISIGMLAAPLYLAYVFKYKYAHFDTKNIMNGIII